MLTVNRLLFFTSNLLNITACESEHVMVKNFGCLYAGIVTGFSHSRVVFFYLSGSCASLYCDMSKLLIWHRFQEKMNLRRALVFSVYTFVPLIILGVFKSKAPLRF